MYVPVNQVIIHTDNDISPVWCRVLISTIAGLLWSWLLNFIEMLSKIKHINHENAVKNVPCKMMAILLGREDFKENL